MDTFSTVQMPKQSADAQNAYSYSTQACNTCQDQVPTAQSLPEFTDLGLPSKGGEGPQGRTCQQDGNCSAGRRRRWCAEPV